MTNEFVLHRRNQVAELRRYIPGEDLTGVAVSEADKALGSPKEGDMIARVPGKLPPVMWLVEASYVYENYAPLG